MSKVVYRILVDNETVSGGFCLEDNVSDENLDARLAHWDEQYPDGRVFYQVMDDKGSFDWEEE